MGREFFLELARSGARAPIGTDLVLHETPDAEKVRRDGGALGRVVVEAARRWGGPLAIPLMDLRLEKIDLLARCGIAESEAESFHFEGLIDEAQLNRICTPLCAGSTARNEALSYVALRTDMVPIGMTIGPCSLATRLMADPITATALAGAGATAENSAEVMLLAQCLRMAEGAVQRSIRSQMAHGARAMMVCEPAAGTAFFSPRQMKAGSDIFERLVMAPNLRVKQTLDEAGCDLIFHDCGELTDFMLRAYAERIHPAVLSLGSSRRLWEDARLVPDDVVLYGNLPTKSFYSDGAMPVSEVIQRTEELVENMRLCGHPHILGSECDVLFVSEAKDAIAAKVEAMMQAGIDGTKADGAARACVCSLG